MEPEEIATDNDSNVESGSEQGEKELYQADSLQLRSSHYSETLEISETVEFDRNLVDKFNCYYTNIIDEFADVEIFLISMDSLLCEFSAHLYHNWTLAGQTIVLAHQVRAYFEKLNDLNAKYKLVWFLDFEHKYKSDAILDFVYSYLMAFLDASEWSAQVEKFKNPLDPKWDDFLKRLTPSFLLMSVEDPSLKIVSEQVSFTPEFVSLLVQLVTIGIPVIRFEAFSINFSTVLAYRIKVVPLSVANMNERIAKIWCNPSVEHDKSLSAGECKNHVDFMALVLKNELKREKPCADFEKFCLSVLLSGYIGLTAGYKRYVPDTALPKVSTACVLKCRRRVMSALVNSLKTLDVHTVKFSLDDLWDGRLIIWIFSNAMHGNPTLPYRLQGEFAKMHEKIGFKEALVTDVEDTLISPSDENNELLINRCTTYEISNDFCDEIFKDTQVLQSIKYSPDEPASYEHIFRSGLKWPFCTVEERLIKSEQQRVLQTESKSATEQKRDNRKRQNMSKWYQAFSDSLEGRGNDLLVDFSRTPRLAAIQEEEVSIQVNGTDKSSKGKKDAKKDGGKKNGKVTKLSKKDQIMEANKQLLIKKQVENDKDKIQYATKVKDNAIQLLKDLRRKLQLDESKAVCSFELAQRYADQFYAKAVRCKTLDEKRASAVEFVGQLKECFTKHWDYLSDLQKDKIEGHWIALGFHKDAKRKPAKEFDLDINIIYFQLYFGGRLIDVQSDPHEDDRVTGFRPDAWQRKMLDIVDRDQSGLIVAPTSAGKTFVSYYCIEKVLRQSNDQVVVYVCPSKALMNQVCGSIYARFRNKPLIGNTTLFGTMVTEFTENVLNCQVLATIPQCLEQLLLSPEAKIQEFVSRIRYVILDEVHSINTAKQGHIWEHIFLLIQCPFLALSATISNSEVMHKWLQDTEDTKKKDRKVELVIYKERWSELELSMQRLKDCPDHVNFARDSELFFKGITLNDFKSGESSTAASLVSLNQEENLLHYFTPYSVYTPEKIRMFSIPDDQQLTARQVIELYTVMAQVDEATKNDFEPAKFFKLGTDVNKKVWLTRTMLRSLENGLKERFLYWLHHDDKKSELVFKILEGDVKEDFDKRMKPFNMYRAVLYNIMSLLENLKTNDMLPAICFNDNRDLCEELAIHVFNELEIREKRYMETVEFKRRFDFKAEDRMDKIAKRAKASKEKAKRKVQRDEDGRVQVQEVEIDEEDSNESFSLLRIKLKEALLQFKLSVRSADEDLYDKTIERLKSRAGNRQSAKILLRLFERGIGFHHEGLTAIERGSVEILFRNGNLGVLFSTSTLALGMNMPCKTVIFGIDTPQLTPLQFRQMSGRAGRRGYDPAGNVVFSAIPTSKIRRLLTASLATLRGNVPYTASFMLRLFTYINGIQEEYKTREEIGEAFKKKIIGKEVAEAWLFKLSMKDAKKDNGEKSQLLVKEGRIAATVALFKKSFALYTRKQNKKGALPAMLQALSFFNIQLLRRLQLIDKNGETTGFAKIAVHLGVYEPGNLLFVHLLQIGAFHHLEKQLKHDEAKLKDTLVLILAHFFTNRRLPIGDNDDKNPVALKSLPEKFEEAIAKYNTDMEQLFIASLQLFFPDQQIENEFFRLSGIHDGMNLTISNIVSAFDDDICLDPNFIPSYLQNKDHRGRMIYRNSYAYDFYVHGSKDLLISENKIDISEVWYLIDEFNRMLQSLFEVLGYSARVTDPVLIAIKSIAEVFDKKFRRAFGMKNAD